MITEEHVVRFFDQANPIPDVELLDMEQIGAARHLATLEQRSSEVTQLDTEQTELTSRKRSMMPWLIAALLAAVVGVAIIVSNQNPDEVPFVGEPTPTTVVDAAPTTTTLSVEVNVATAEALNKAIYEGDVEAIDNLPWANPGSNAHNDASDTALFGAALNVNVLASSCVGETVEVVTCQTQTSDDLSNVLGGGVVNETQEISFNDSGEITGLVSEAQDGGVGEVFTNWAWNIAYPGLCDSPAQCAEALLGVVVEYNETYPGAAIASYVAAYNAADVDAVVELFAEDAVITLHPGGDYAGITEIRTLHEAEADGTVVYDISNVVVDGDTVTWDHVWSGLEENGDPFENCVTGHTAIVEAGQIVSWTWPVTNFQCG